MARIFLSYRRTDSRWVAGRIYDRLTEVLSKENVFLDVNNIEAGEDFFEAIKRIVSSCDILIALIGPNWLTVKDTTGRSRLENADDLVRVEIATALRREIRVIPILIDDAIMPESALLPDDLKPLTRRNVKEISFSRFHADLDSLTAVLQSLLNLSETTQPPAAKQDATGDRTEAATSSTAGISRVLPLTISVETAGGEATSIINQGEILPAEGSIVFTTGEDNQSAVQIGLFWGERPLTRDNLSLGEFTLEHIDPAPAGVPQIEITTRVDKSLLMTVTARNTKTGHTEVLDSVDLTQIEIPDEMAGDIQGKPPVRESQRDAMSFNLSDDSLEGLFNDSASPYNPQVSIDLHRTIHITRSEAVSGKVSITEGGTGQALKFKIPAGIHDGAIIRLRGQGKKDGERAGDLFIKVRVKEAQ